MARRPADKFKRPKALRKDFLDAKRAHAPYDMTIHCYHARAEGECGICGDHWQPAAEIAARAAGVDE